MKTFILCLLLSLTTYANPPQIYSKLTTKDLDEMSASVQAKIKESRKDEALAPLKEALVLVLSRPDEDGMVAKLFPPIRNELETNDAYEKVVDLVVDEALQALKEPKKHKPEVQNTYLIILTNLLSELKPQTKEPESFANKVFVKIRDAEIEITDSASREYRMKVMKKLTSPSDIAAKIVPKK